MNWSEGVSPIAYRGSNSYDNLHSKGPSISAHSYFFEELISTRRTSRNLISPLHFFEKLFSTRRNVRLTLPVVGQLPQSEPSSLPLCPPRNAPLPPLHLPRSPSNIPSFPPFPNDDASFACSLPHPSRCRREGGPIDG